MWDSFTIQSHSIATYRDFFSLLGNFFFALVQNLSTSRCCHLKFLVFLIQYNQIIPVAYLFTMYMQQNIFANYKDKLHMYVLIFAL